MSLTDTRGAMSWNSLNSLQMMSRCCGDVGRRWNYHENIMKLSWKDVEKMLKTCFTHDCHDFLIKMTRKVFWSDFFYGNHKQIIYMSYTKNGLMRRQLAGSLKAFCIETPKCWQFSEGLVFFWGYCRECFENVSRTFREPFTNIFKKKVFAS